MRFVEVCCSWAATLPGAPTITTLTTDIDTKIQIEWQTDKVIRMMVNLVRYPLEMARAIMRRQ